MLFLVYRCLIGRTVRCVLSRYNIKYRIETMSIYYTLYRNRVFGHSWQRYRFRKLVAFSIFKYPYHCRYGKTKILVIVKVKNTEKSCPRVRYITIIQSVFYAHREYKLLTLTSTNAQNDFFVIFTTENSIFMRQRR